MLHILVTLHLVSIGREVFRDVAGYIDPVTESQFADLQGLEPVEIPGHPF
jgi:hypothetical protein